MTPPDNTERRGSTTDQDAEGVAPPPWQRVAKDAGGAGNGVADQDGEGFGDRWSAGQLPTTGSPQQEQRPPNGTEDTQIVSGSAANRLFGQEAETAQMRPPYDAAQAGARQGGGAKGRGAPVSALRRPGRGPRRASLQVKRFDPWSVLKLSLVLGVAMFFVWLVAVGVLYTVLDGMGVWDKLNGTYTSLVQGDAAETADEPLISAGRVFGVAAIVGAINIVLISALTTVGAFIYNVSADLAGGLEVTLSERE
ncbi:DUF3566 domain-containing protein [Qaidamihabitans albus]|uniref:DUF3566 domain-containing protein n=1 Tax=Qaidamihabitans albus TaxID=2795733 RepID=UPI0018F14679|nr:DUF3566 domain-containing protein [Qaidamihabitans albus]